MSRGMAMAGQIGYTGEYMQLITKKTSNII